MGSGHNCLGAICYRPSDCGDLQHRLRMKDNKDYVLVMSSVSQILEGHLMHQIMVVL